MQDLTPTPAVTLSSDSLQQPINQPYLTEGNTGNGCPGQGLAQAKTGLSRFTETELHFDRANFDQVTIPQDSALKRLAVNRGQSVGRGLQNESFGRLELDAQMLIPNSVPLEAQIASRGTT